MHNEVAERAALRDLPSVDEVLRSDVVVRLLQEQPRWAVLEAIQEEIREARFAIRRGELSARPNLDEQTLRAAVAKRTRQSLRMVINGTGVVVHTNLGRAPLHTSALAQVIEVAGHYSNLEYNLDSKSRGSRHDHVSALIGQLTGAEAACVTNNNAAAVLLVLAAMAQGREVIVSRGELVEIGGSFRIPDVMRASGCVLREVGTTNKTHPRDYEAALCESTALLLKVHRSNFAVVGFTSEVTVAQLVAIGKAKQIPVAVDLGSGCLADLVAMGLPHEPTPREVLEGGAGADLVMFSGDKLLGGPQAGVIAGRGALVERVRRHPLMRALRPDKMTLAALEGTLSLYRDGRAAEVPVLDALGASLSTLRRRARTLESLVRKHAPRMRPSVVNVTSQVGGGALPLAAPPSYAVALEPKDLSTVDLEEALRKAKPPIIARIEDDRVLLDVRCLLQAKELKMIAQALAVV